MNNHIGVDQGYQVAKHVREAKLWMVRSDGNVVGPVSLELIERGLQAGKIPADAEMTHAQGTAWRRIADLFPQARQPIEAARPGQAPARFVPPSRPSRAGIAAPPVPPPPPSIRYPEEPISVPRLGVMAALFN